jgi:hypothetical protein
MGITISLRRTHSNKFMANQHAVGSACRKDINNMSHNHEKACKILQVDTIHSEHKCTRTYRKHSGAVLFQHSTTCSFHLNHLVGKTTGSSLSGMRVEWTRLARCQVFFDWLSIDWLIDYDWLIDWLWLIMIDYDWLIDWLIDRKSVNMSNTW